MRLDTTRQPEEDRFTSWWTREQLDAAFGKVANPNDWKAAVDGFCHEDEVELVREAVVFFTATEPRFYRVGTTTLFRVQADGYRMGPAGP